MRLLRVKTESKWCNQVYSIQLTTQNALWYIPNTLNFQRLQNFAVHFVNANFKTLYSTEEEVPITKRTQVACTIS